MGDRRKLEDEMAKGEVAPRRGGLGSLSGLQSEIDRLFEDFAGAWGGRKLPWFTEESDGFSMPKLDVSETKEALQVSAELPGIAEKDIHVEVADGVLTITGEHEDKKEEKDKKYHRVERSRRAYRRAMSLPAGIDEAEVSATLKNGVLEITIPKTAEAKAKTRKIEVKAS
jgi:HSP20 family protein